MIVQRENFPKSHAGETVAARRQRFVAWLKQTHDETTAAYRASADDPKVTDPEYKAAQQPTKANCIAAKCWQCVHGSDPQADPQRQGWSLVTHCKTVSCQLHSVRPHQPAGQKAPKLRRADASFEGINQYDHSAKALANPGNRALAVRGYCHACCGGQPGTLTMREIAACTVVVCPLWEIRPGAGQAQPEEAAP